MSPCLYKNRPLFLQTQVKSTAFVDHFCRNVFPVFDLIDGDDSKAQILKLLAEFCIFTGDIPDPSAAVKNIHEKLQVTVEVQFKLFPYNMCSLT